MSNNSITINAYAKINLTLDVTGVRPNGYHDLKMIMQTIDLYDTLEISFVSERLASIMGIGGAGNSENNGLSVTIKCDDPTVPTGPENLIYKAAVVFFDEAFASRRTIPGFPEGLARTVPSKYKNILVKLKKRIPSAAGLAGGSADAAAMLRALNILCGTNLNDKKLCEIGCKVGADVPFCIMGGTMLAEGIGEVLTRLPKAPDCKLLIVKPEEGMSTKYVYDNLVLDENTVHPNTDLAVFSLINGDVKGLSKQLCNVLETVAIPALPLIADIKNELLSLGATGALMSGSGSTVFGIFNERIKAENAYAHFKSGPHAAGTFLTKFVTPSVPV